MAEQKQQRSAQQNTEQGIIAKILMGIMQLFVFLLLTLLFSVMVEWAGMATKYWEEPGAMHSEQMLKQELTYLNNDFKRSAIVDQPIQFARNFANQFYIYSFEKTGIKQGIIWLATPTQATNTGRFRKKIRQLYVQISDYILAMATVTQIFAVRLAILILALPAFILLSLTGFIDGLVQRDIRRWSAGRESSFVYHWAKKMLYPSLILPWIIYLAIPVSVHPNFVVLPFAFIFAISVTVMASTFKKYL